MRYTVLLSAALVTVAVVLGCERAVETHVAVAPEAGATTQASTGPATQPGGVEKLVLSDEEWRKRLTPAQFDILRRKGTEPPFTGPYHDWKGKTGTFVCVGCDLPLFEAKTKFDSGTGWPSFYDAVKGHVLVAKDNSFGMERDSLSCARCDGHLGHVFQDGPNPTGLRYCIDGYALKLVDEKK